MHDFSCTDPKDMYYKILADRVRYFKEDEEGVLTMCREMENMRKAERIEIAKRMLASGKLTYEDIAAFTDLTLEENQSSGCTEDRITFVSRFLCLFYSQIIIAFFCPYLLELTMINNRGCCTYRCGSPCRMDEEN